MEVFNLIKNTVSTVLPGNPVTREYEVSSHVASAGPGLLWKVYNAVKKSTKQEAAVFVLEKKLLDRYSKKDKDLIIELFKKGISNLTRLRHPCILTVQHPLEESRESLAFATEPIFASLANILGDQENMPSPLPPDLKGFELHDVEIKYGLLQLSEGLAFLHNDVKMVHHNLCPQSIIINKSGVWKLAGFDFALSPSNGHESTPTYQFPPLESGINPLCQPHLDFLAPEGGSSSCDTFSDMFSLGLLIYSIYNHGSSLISSSGSLGSWKQSLNQFKDLSLLSLKSLPPDSREHIKLLLCSKASLRPDAFQLSKLKMFDDVGVKTLQYLDSLYQWDNLQKSQFYKGLPQIISHTPKRICLQRILPCLAKEYVNHEMIPFVLPNVLLIAEEATKEEFVQLILNDLVPIFKLQEPIQIILIFMQKMELLLTKCPPDTIRNHILPMIYNAFESDAQQIQELCLSIIPNFANLIEYPAMKNALLPKIKKLCLTTNFLSVRVNCLICIGKLLEHLDKWLVLDEVLPFMAQIPSKEPAVLMGILGILKLTMSHKKLGITKDVLATKVIPFLMPLSIENGLTINQFNSIIALLKEMVNQVELEHKTKLEQLNSIRKEHHSTIDMANSKDKVIDVEPPIKPTKELDEFLGYEASSQLSMTTSLGQEQKEKKVWQQEQQKRFVSQPRMMTPTSTTNKFPQAAAVAPPPQTRDLTSTLIANNLAGLGLKQQVSSYITPRPNYTPFQSSPVSRLPPLSGMVTSPPVRNMAPLDNLFNNSQLPNAFSIPGPPTTKLSPVNNNNSTSIHKDLKDLLG